METTQAIPAPNGAETATATTQATQLPHWLQTPQLPTPEDPRPHSSRQSRALTRTIYGNLFENALDRIMGGTPLQTIVRNDPRGIELGRFLFWINRDPDRRARYEEACFIAAETMAHELTAIADALPPDGTPGIVMEDTQRSALRMKARTYLMERWSPQRYGDSKRIQIDSTTVSASMTAEDLTRLSLADLRSMAARVFSQQQQRDDTIDVTPTPTPDDDQPPLDDTPLDDQP